jgi:hypothetical protein
VWGDAQAGTDKVGAIVRPQGEWKIVPDHAASEPV